MPKKMPNILYVADSDLESESDDTAKCRVAIATFTDVNGFEDGAEVGVYQLVRRATVRKSVVLEDANRSRRRK